MKNIYTKTAHAPIISTRWDIDGAAFLMGLFFVFFNLLLMMDRQSETASLGFSACIIFSLIWMLATCCNIILKDIAIRKRISFLYVIGDRCSQTNGCIMAVVAFIVIFLYGPIIIGYFLFFLLGFILLGLVERAFMVIFLPKKSQQV